MEEPLWKNFNLTDYPETGDKITATVSMATLTDQYLVQVGGLKRHYRPSEKGLENVTPTGQNGQNMTS